MRTIVVAVLLAASSVFADGDSTAFMAGAATADITPPVGLPMWGYGSRRDDPSEGVMDPLEANALVLCFGDEKLALVGLDVGRPPTRKSMDRIRAAVKEKAGVQYLFVVGSHTHHGPCVEIPDQPSKENSYQTKFEDGIIQAIVEAESKKVPAKWAVGRVQTKNRNRNRQSKIEPIPVDRELAVIRVVDRNGKSIATAVNFAAHPTSIDAHIMLYSPDFPGDLKKEVVEKLGGVCLYLQGAAGDLSTDRAGTKDFHDYGRQLGDEVVALAKSLKPKVPENPNIKYREEDFHYPEMRVDYKNPLVRILFNRAFFKELVDAYMDEYKDGVHPKITVALLNDEVGLVGGSGEFFCNHALRLKERARLPHLLFFGYCNDYQWYFPTIEAAAEGGYGADGTVSPVAVGAGEQMTNRALFHLYDMQKKFKGLTIR